MFSSAKPLRWAAGLLCLFLLSAALGVWQARVAARGEVTAWERLIATLAEPLQKTMTRAYTSVTSFSMALGHADRLTTENRRLREENVRLRAERITLAESQQEVERLRRLLDLREGVTYRAVAASLIARNSREWTTYLVLDRGSSDGLRPRQPVLAEDGLVGQVYAVTERTANVLSLTDRTSYISARLERTHQLGTVVGLGGGMCALRYLPPEAEARSGDRVISSGLGGIYPEGFLIGRVLSVKRDRSTATLEALLQPAVNPGAVKEVLVLITPSRL